MKLSIDQYKIGDEVDVFANASDSFYDFSGRIIDINEETGIVTVKDQDEDCWDVDVDQICLTYDEEQDTTTW